MDFSEAEISSRRWWLRLEWLMDQIENRNYKDVYRLSHLQHLLSMPVSSKEGIEGHWKEAGDIRERYIDRTFPWLAKKSANKNLEKSVVDLRNQWADIWGDPNNPDTQRRIWQTVRAMNPKAEIPREFR